MLLLSRFPLIQHQTPAVALVSRTRLRAIGDVLPIRRIERSFIRRLVVASDVLRLDELSLDALCLYGRDARPSSYWNNPQVIIGAGGFNSVMVRGVANLQTIRRESIIVLPAEREHRRIVIAGRQIVGARSWACTRRFPVTRRSGCPHPPTRAVLGRWRAQLARPDEGVRAYVVRVDASFRCTAID